VVSDGAAGNEKQALALAAAMGLTPVIWRVRLPWFWRAVAPRLIERAGRALPADMRAAANTAAPDIVIGCGRQAALVGAVLRQQLSAFAVQILDPRVDARHWDVVVVPAHDALRGDQVIVTQGALNDIDGARLAAAALRHADLTTLAAPRTAVLIGGARRAPVFGNSAVRGLLVLLNAWQEGGGTMMISASRRTPASWRKRLRNWAALHGARYYDGNDAAAADNPYLGFLAHAQRIVVTADSVNMLSEACATGKAVFVYAPKPLRGKLARFYRELLESGHVRPLRAAPAAWAPTPLRESIAVASEVWRRYRARSRA
jgi:hypothetical protein